MNWCVFWKIPTATQKQERADDKPGWFKGIITGGKEPKEQD